MAAGDGGMLGNGVKIGYRGVDSPVAAWQVVGQIMEASGLSLEAEPFDADVHSTSRFIRQGPGKINVAPLVMKLLCNPNPTSGQGDVQDALYQLLLDGTSMEWRIEVPANREQTLFFGREFDGWVSTFNQEQPIREGQVVTVGIVFDSDTISRDAAAAASEM